MFNGDAFQIIHLFKRKENTENKNEEKETIFTRSN